MRSVLGDILPHYNPKTGFQWSPIRGISNLFSAIETAGAPLHEAAQIDWKLKHPDVEETGNSLTDWFSAYRAKNSVPEPPEAIQEVSNTLSSSTLPAVPELSLPEIPKLSVLNLPAVKLPDIPAVQVPDISLPKIPALPSFSSQKTPMGLTDNDRQMFEQYGLRTKPESYYQDIKERLSTIQVPSFRGNAALRASGGTESGPVSSAKQSASEGGTTIENQNNTINVYGSGDPATTAQMTVDTLNTMATSAPNNGLIPFMR